MGAMLCLLAMLAAASYFSLQTTIDLFEAVTDREFTEMRRLVYLQDITREATKPIYRYLAWGDPEEAARFKDVEAEVEQSYMDVLVMPSLKLRQRSLILNAQREWHLAATVGSDLLSKPLDDDRTAAVANDFDNHVTRSIDTIYQAHNIRIAAIEDHKQAATEGYRTMRSLSAAAFFAAVAIFVVASVTMARYILTPLATLKDSIDRFARGELSHRVPLSNANELGDLARGFNNMAERLQRHQSSLEQLAIRDSLTGLYNRREFERLLSEELQRSQRYHHAVSLLLVDIDNFKDINDSHGHAAGDNALRVLAQVIRDMSRNGDIVARYGGEELTVILPETPSDDAVAMAERMRNAVAGQPIMLPHGDVIALTASIGVATFPHDATTEGKLVDIADQAMYLAKAAGRNCVRRAQAADGGDKPPVAMN